MPLKVLLADDNITAQRLGSKILTDAGHTVIAVSNGAAAVKKLAAEKPDILILDVFMPGYTGLEVCEKSKSDPATAQIPVILTVTNMEPYNQADGNRVHADGVMIKPFEATDLLAIVQKFEAKSAKAAPAPQATQKISMEEDASYEEWKSEAPEEAEPAKMEISQEMAAAPALGMDDMMPEPAHAASMEEPAPATFSVDSDAPTASIEIASEPGPPAFGVEEPAPPTFESAPPAMDWAPVEAEPAPLEMPPVSLEPSVDAAAPPPELEYTAQQDIGHVQVQQAAELEVAESAGNAVIAQDPALVTDADEMSQFATKLGVENPEEIPVGVAMPGLTAAEEPPAPEPSDEYPTTIKMEAYSEPAPVEEPAAEAPAPVEEAPSAFAAGSSGAAAAPAMEPEAFEHHAAEPPPVHDELVAQFAAELDQIHQEREAMGVTEPAPVEEAPLTEASMPPAPDIPASQLDEERIAAAVNRALEKYKDGLRQELIATIVRELKG